MTRLNLKDKIVDVEALLVGNQFATEVWMSKKAQKSLDKYAKRRQVGKRLLKKLKEWARNGFQIYEGPELPIRQEARYVYRIGHHASLFRLIGFYEHGDRGIFIVIDAFLKRDTDLSPNHAKRIKEVGRIRRDNLWRKIDGE